MAPWPVFVLAGAAIGALTGLFGVGGSSIATPLLAVLGIPGLLAVASPLPATIPAAPRRGGTLHPTGRGQARAAGWTLLGALPAAVAGALLSELVGGRALLIASGLVLAVVGERVLRPIEPAARASGGVRRKDRLLLVAASAGVGLFTGLLEALGGPLRRQHLLRLPAMRTHRYVLARQWCGDLDGAAYDESHEVMWVPAKEWARLRRG